MNSSLKSTNQLIGNEKQKILFERGFKTWCENISITIRKRMGLAPYIALSPYDLALKLGVTVLKLDEVPSLDGTTRSYLSSEEGNEWSAVTISVNNRETIIVNPTHSIARQSSDLMHELSHIIKKHEAARVFVSESGYALREYNEKQEVEADWFAGTLLLPRTVLSYCTYKRIPLQQILKYYSVSKMLYDYRVRMTGVNKQYSKTFSRNSSVISL